MADTAPISPRPRQTVLRHASRKRPGNRRSFRVRHGLKSTSIARTDVANPWHFGTSDTSRCAIAGVAQKSVRDCSEVAKEARQAVLTDGGQKLLARIRPSSKYHGQSDEGAMFSVCIGPGGDYCVLGGPGGQYRLRDVDLFAVFDETKSPTQITFEPAKG